MSFEDVVRELLSRKASPPAGQVAGREVLLWCPFHPDGEGKPPHSPSLRLNREKDSWYCDPCGKGGLIAGLAARLGLDRADEVERAYDYRDGLGNLKGQVVRLPGKQFRRRRPDGVGGWIWNWDGVDIRLYRLPELQSASVDDWVFVVEGEKDVDRLGSLGLTATTNAGGAKKWRDGHSDTLQGRKVAIIPDNDEVGLGHAEAVAGLLAGKASEVRIVRLPVKGKGEDVSDWLDQGGTAERLLELAEEAEAPTCEPYRQSQVGRGIPIVGLEELRQRHSGEVRWIVGGYLARGEVIFLAGAGESLKSWTATHLAAAVDGGFKWLGNFDVSAERVLFIEQERAGNLVYQLNRIEVGEQVTLGSERLKIIPPTSLPLSEPDTQAELKAVVNEFKPDVVIINALRDVLGRANENSPTDIAALLRPLGRIAEEVSCCILIIDHFNKAGMSGLTRGNTAHGGTAQKHNEADAVLIAERPRDEMGKGEGPATISVSKRRSGDFGRPFAVSVSDTADGGVLVRAEEGVKAHSPTANSVFRLLKGKRRTVAELSEETGKTKDTIRQALSELRVAGLIDSEGPEGKVHVYWRTDLPTCDSLIDSQVGSEDQVELKCPSCGGLTLHAKGPCMPCQAESFGAVRISSGPD